VTYDEYVSLILNSERIRLRQLIDMSEAVAIGRGDKTVPDEWIELLTDNEMDRIKWKQQEFKKGVQMRR